MLNNSGDDDNGCGAEIFHGYDNLNEILQNLSEFRWKGTMIGFYGNRGSCQDSTSVRVCACL